MKSPRQRISAALPGQPAVHTLGKLTLSLALVFVLVLPSSSASASVFVLTEGSIADINSALDSGALSSETLVEMFLARIAAYDSAGPRLNAVLTLNPQALATARELDEERKTQGRRSPLHGIPMVLKDNIDTADLPTTAGSFLLAGSIPPDDAFLVRKLRQAGAVILAKVNLSELASGDALSSLGGVTLNPHDLDRSPSGSSGGTGAAIAAVFAQVGLGTDTGGSVRSPSTANGIVGLKPTHGLLSRDGVIPLALSFDMAGPMARHVYDVAAALGVMTGIDPADGATRKSEGQITADYTAQLDAEALKGARIGVARDFMKQDSEVDWVVEASLERMREAGATVIDVEIPDWLLEANVDFYWTIRHREFRAQIADYLATLPPEYPKTLEDLVTRSDELTAPRDGAWPNPSRWSLLRREDESGELTDSDYRAMRDHGLPLVRATVAGILETESLDAIVYPTSPRRPSRIDGNSGSGGSGHSPIRFANLTGFPDLVVPAGFTSRGLPVGLSFLGPAFSEARLLAIGYAFEQATQARRTPVTTPPLPDETISY